jgi:putative transposon-encoded protein
VTGEWKSSDQYFLKQLGFYMADKEEKNKNVDDLSLPRTKVKFEVYGEEMIEKEVKSSGNSGRIYLPPNWVGHIVKIIKVE